MTSNQQAIINFIRDYPRQYPPTLREIAAGVGIKSSTTVHRNLTKLVELGLVESKNNCPRCIALTERCLCSVDE